MRFNLSLEHVAAGTLAVCIVGFTLGSGSIPSVKSDAQSLRWIPLFVLWAVSAALFVRLRRLSPQGVSGAVLLLGGFLLGLMLVSTAWSDEPRLTFERAVSFAVVLTATGAVGVASTRDPRLARLLLGGIVAGIGIVTVVGLLMLLWRENYAAQLAVTSSPWRFRGLGENPNTVSMLCGIASPVVLWATLSASTPRRRIASGATLVLAFTTIALSGSHGAILAAAVGEVVFGLGYLPSRKGMLVVAFSVFALLGSIEISKIPQAATVPASATSASSASTSTAQTGSSSASASTAQPKEPAGAGSPATLAGDYPLGGLADEVGIPTDTSKRSLFGTSGRVQAWRGAIGQGNQRALLGYGFGTEEHVFFDRYQTFEGDRPENSFIGLYLDLGLTGVVVLLALLLAMLLAGLGALRRVVDPERPIVQACLGAGFAGALVMVVQSYVYSAGDVATLTFWMCGSLLVAGRSWAAQTGGALLSERTPAGRTIVARPSRSVVTATGVGVLLLVILIPVGRWQRHRAIVSAGHTMSALVALTGPELRSNLSGSRPGSTFDCLLYKVGVNPAGIELCFSSDGHLVESIDRRGTTPKFLSFRDQPSSSPVKIPLPTLIARFHDAGTLETTPVDAASLPVGFPDGGPILLPRAKVRK